MRAAIISDIHGNLEALEEVFKFVTEQGIEKIYCLGDVVGYGPNPNECIELIREKCHVVLMGNHDYAAIGQANIDYFNEYARRAAYWTMEQLTDENHAYLTSLPFTHQNDEIILLHASPTNPRHWYYVLSQDEAKIEMNAFNQPLCFIGHSHVPVIFSKSQMFREEVFSFEKGEKYIVNVGSVGQPRDGNSKSCFAIFDQDKLQIEYVRLNYNMQKTYKKIIKAGLPHFLADRLLKGY
jgi:predicted phosphodiesterase